MPDHDIMHLWPCLLSFPFSWVISCNWNPLLGFVFGKRQTAVISFCWLSNRNSSKHCMSYHIFSGKTCTRYTENSEIMLGRINVNVRCGFTALLIVMAKNVALWQHAEIFFTFFGGLLFGVWLICEVILKCLGLYIITNKAITSQKHSKGVKWCKQAVKHEGGSTGWMIQCDWCQLLHLYLELTFSLHVISPLR